MPTHTCLLGVLLCTLWLHLLLFTVVFHVVVRQMGVRYHDAVVESLFVVALGGVAAVAWYSDHAWLCGLVSIPILLWFGVVWMVFTLHVHWQQQQLSFRGE